MMLKRFFFRFWKRDSLRKISWIEKYLSEDTSILDIGAGPCWVTYFLRNGGFDITPIDKQDLSTIDNIRPMIFDGKEIPFADDEFDVSLLLTVLHHVEKPVSFLKEAKRVSKKIVIIEDTYNSNFMEILTKFTDSLMNLEFKDHPHSNKTDKVWRQLFKEMDLKVIHSQTHRIGGIFTQSVYLLEKSFH